MNTLLHLEYDQLAFGGWGEWRAVDLSLEVPNPERTFLFVSCSSDVKQNASPFTLHLQGLALDFSSVLCSCGRHLNLCWRCLWCLALLPQHCLVWLSWAIPVIREEHLSWAWYFSAQKMLFCNSWLWAKPSSEPFWYLPSSSAFWSSIRKKA